LNNFVVQQTCMAMDLKAWNDVSFQGCEVRV
jgi:hypothetical protein